MPTPIPLRKKYLTGFRSNNKSGSSNSTKKPRNKASSKEKAGVEQPNMVMVMSPTGSTKMVKMGTLVHTGTQVRLKDE